MNRAALTCAVAFFVTMAAPAHAQGNGITHQHNQGEKRVARDGGPAQAQTDYVTSLDEETVKKFIADVQRMVMTGMQTMTADDVANWFNNHIATKARFESMMKYEMPGYPAQDSTMSIGKEEYINGILSARSTMSDYQQDVQIQEIKIGNGGRSAKVRTKITETGNMPWPKDGAMPDGRPPEMVPMPVTGTAECEQTIGISINNFIQMQKAACRTVMSFDPFKREELGDEMFFGR